MNQVDGDEHTSLYKSPGRKETRGQKSLQRLIESQRSQMKGYGKKEDFDNILLKKKIKEFIGIRRELLFR